MRVGRIRLRRPKMGEVMADGGLTQAKITASDANTQYASPSHRHPPPPYDNHETLNFVNLPPPPPFIPTPKYSRAAALMLC